MGRDWHCSLKYKAWFEEAGFVDVVEKVFAWPFNTWPKGRKNKLMGRFMLRNSLEGLNSISMAILTRGENIEKEEVEELLADVKRDLADRRIHAYCPV
jgi:hypothetical protein